MQIVSGPSFHDSTICNVNVQMTRATHRKHSVLLQLGPLYYETKGADYRTQDHHRSLRPTPYDSTHAHMADGRGRNCQVGVTFAQSRVHAGLRRVTEPLREHFSGVQGPGLGSKFQALGEAG